MRKKMKESPLSPEMLTIRSPNHISNSKNNWRDYRRISTKDLTLPSTNCKNSSIKMHPSLSKTTLTFSKPVNLNSKDNAPLSVNTNPKLELSPTPEMAVSSPPDLPTTPSFYTTPTLLNARLSLKATNLTWCPSTSPPTVLPSSLAHTTRLLKSGTLRPWSV